jgi:hypothetical protein
MIKTPKQQNTGKALYLFIYFQKSIKKYFSLKKVKKCCCRVVLFLIV